MGSRCICQYTMCAGVRFVKSHNLPFGFTPDSGFGDVQVLSMQSDCLCTLNYVEIYFNLAVKRRVVQKGLHGEVVVVWLDLGRKPHSMCCRCGMADSRGIAIM